MEPPLDIVIVITSSSVPPQPQKKLPTDNVFFLSFGNRRLDFLSSRRRPISPRSDLLRVVVSFVAVFCGHIALPWHILIPPPSKHKRAVLYSNELRPGNSSLFLSFLSLIAASLGWLAHPLHSFILLRELCGVEVGVRKSFPSFHLAGSE